ncbi:MAG: HAMP domain-containing protein, partial [Acidimicrobiia bacterium]
MSGLRVAGYVGATVCLPLVALGLGVALTVDADDRGHLIVVSVAVAVVASLVAGASLLVAYRIAARTVDAMAERARAIAEGDPSGAVPIPVRGPREVTDLARAFNGMVDRVRRYMLDLERSQMEFRQSVRRLGDALVATHDPPGILGVAVDSARTVLGGRTAVAWLRNGDQLVPVASDGEVLAGRALAVGWGLAGEVAAAGRGRVDGMTSATAEPQR